MRPEHPRVTVVNDNPEFLQLMQDLLQDATWPATLIDGDRENAADLIAGSNPDVLIMDLRMGSDRLTGLDVIREVRGRDALREVPVLLCTADRWGLEAVQDELNAMERIAVLPKPFSIDELYAAIDGLLED